LKKKEKKKLTWALAGLGGPWRALFVPDGMELYQLEISA
jgi:hypothetical protein